jgi:uncharacterized protein
MPTDGVPTDGVPRDGVPTDGVPTDGVPRDRDPSGRPRNARPRDGLGRPLARNVGQQRADAGQDSIPDDLVITGRDAAVLADQLLRDGRPFHAHEVLEAAWKTGPPGDRDLWQGLAQIAVGLTHARRGNARGAVTLLRRGTQRIRAHQAGLVPPPGPAPPPGPVASPGPGAPPGTAPPPGPGAHPGPGASYGMDIPAVLAAMEDLAARVEQDGLDHIPAAALALHLLAGNR